jgi:hypothetical protein
MTRKRTGTPFDTLLRSSAFEIDDPELLTLRAHAMLEAILYHLLAATLSIPEQDLPQLSLFQLVELALPGAEEQTLRNALSQFTRIRNTVAHALKPLGYTPEMQAFAALLDSECHNHRGRNSALGPYREGLRALLFTVALKAKFARQAPKPQPPN